MTTPTVLSNFGYDLNNCPGVDREGAVRSIVIDTTVTSGNAAATTYELFPFQANMTLLFLALDVPDVSDASSTMSLGYVYDDNTTYTNDPDAYVATDQAPRSGGFIMYPTTFNSGTAGVDQGKARLTDAPGYVIATLNTSAADATADLTGYALVTYGGKESI